MEMPTIKGKHSILRKMRESDIDDRFVIGRHHEFIHMCGGESLPEPEYPDKSVWKAWYDSNMDSAYTWIIEVDERCIGSTGFHHVSLEDNAATYRIGIFDPAYHSKGIGTEATMLLLQYGFETMHWHRIDLKVLEYNVRGIRCYQKCGFVMEGVLRENARIENQYYSDIIMSILESEYQERKD